MTETSQPIRIHLASRRPLIRAGLRRFLEIVPDIEVADREGELRPFAAGHCPHVLLLDGWGADRQSLVQAISEVQGQCPETAILVLLVPDDDAILATLLTTGIAGVVPDDITGEDLRDAVRQAAHGKVLFTREHILRAQRWQEEVQKPWTTLTPRERDVAVLVAQGLDNRSIATQLVLDVRTVEGHVASLREKLGQGSRAAVVAWMRDHAAGADRPPKT